MPQCQLVIIMTIFDRHKEYIYPKIWCTFYISNNNFPCLATEVLFSEVDAPIGVTFVVMFTSFICTSASAGGKKYTCYQRPHFTPWGVHLIEISWKKLCLYIHISYKLCHSFSQLLSYKNCIILCNRITNNN